MSSGMLGACAASAVFVRSSRRDRRSPASGSSGDDRAGSALVPVLQTLVSAMSAGETAWPVSSPACTSEQASCEVDCRRRHSEMTQTTVAVHEASTAARAAALPERGRAYVVKDDQY
jgi:hypothetical protein